MSWAVDLVAATANGSPCDVEAIDVNLIGYGQRHFDFPFGGRC